MKQLANIEFFNDPQGGVMLSDAQGVRSYTVEDAAFTSALYARIEEEYPEAFKALTAEYRKSQPNVPYYRYLVCSRFIRCNFGQYDSRADIDGVGRFVFEDVPCPMRCECRLAGVVCHPKLNTHLSARQAEVMKLYAEGHSYDDIADVLYISPETVKTTIRNAFRKAGVHSLAEFMQKYTEL